MTFGSAIYTYLNTLCHKVSEYIRLLGCISTIKEVVACFFPVSSGEKRPLEVMPFVYTELIQVPCAMHFQNIYGYAGVSLKS